INRINRSQATTLVVGLGAPKQEIWIHKNRRKLKTVSTFLAIGAGLDFLAGNQQRSPKWMSNAGLEWLYRLLSEPQRLWKRYLVESLPFFWLLPQQALNTYQPPHYGVDDVDNWDGERAVLAMVRAGLLTEEQLDVARSQQQDHSHLTLAEIVSVRGWLTKQTVDFFVERLPSLKRDMRQQPLGDYLVAADLLDDAQLAALLWESRQETLQQDGHQRDSHREERRCIGDLAVQNGWLTRQTVDFFLAEVAPECESLPYEIFDRPSVTELPERRRFTTPSPGMGQAAT
ncbi:MAG: WecB/TagA/CpsF family glycosyltransferase, partial [Cyanobacteria bacterium P01_G01_bin.4]